MKDYCDETGASFVMDFGSDRATRSFSKNLKVEKFAETLSILDFL